MASKVGRKLNERQAKFVQEYLTDLNACQAAIRAGYSVKSADKIGSQLLGKPGVKQALQEAQQKRAAKLEISAEWVLNNLKSVAERCLQEEPVMKFNHDTKTMEETGEYKFDSSGANKSLELIGKHLGMFTDKVQVSGPGGGPVQLLFAGIIRPVVNTGDD